MTSEPDHSRRYKVVWPDCDVRHLILSNDDFIVFLDDDLDVDWCTSQNYDDLEGENDAKERSEILNRAATVECIPNDHQIENVRLNFKRMIGEGVARALERDHDSAKKIIEQARLYIETRNVEKARCWQLSTACVIGVILAFSGLTLWWFRDDLIPIWGDPVYFLIMSGFAGSIGAVLSMILRMGRSFPTSEAPRFLHTLEAASRILAGYFSGLLAAGAVRVGLILPVANTDQMHSVMVLVAFASGASERLEPSIIARFESTSSERQLKNSKTQ